MPDPALPARIAAVRRFNRFYTRRIGVLQEGLLKSPFSLTEARVLYELAHREDATASALVRDLGLDAGYLSRLLKGFEERGLIRRAASPLDARQSLLTLTALGRAAFAPLDHRSQDEIGAMLRGLPAPAQKRLVEDMAEIETLLGERPAPSVPYVLRTASARRSRDGSSIAMAHSMPGNMAGTTASRRWWRRSPPNSCASSTPGASAAGSPSARGRSWARCWSCARATRSQSCACSWSSPPARGLGIGRRLVEECLSFARHAGYTRMTLWTNDVLHAARHIYEQAGFQLTAREPHHAFGKDLVSETWERDL